MPYSLLVQQSTLKDQGQLEFSFTSSEAIPSYLFKKSAIDGGKVFALAQDAHFQSILYVIPGVYEIEKIISVEAVYLVMWQLQIWLLQKQSNFWPPSYFEWLD